MIWDEEAQEWEAPPQPTGDDGPPDPDDDDYDDPRYYGPQTDCAGRPVLDDEARR